MSDGHPPGAASRPLLVFQGMEALIVDALDEAGVGFVWSDGTRVLHANDALCRLTGRSHREMQAMVDPFVLLPDEQRESLRDAMGRRLAGEQVASAVETTIDRPDGTRVRIRVFVRTAETAGNPPEVIAIVRDALEMGADQMRATTRRFLHAMLGAERWQHGALEAAGARFGRAMGRVTIEDGLREFDRLGIGTLVQDVRTDGTHPFTGVGLVDPRDDKDALHCVLAQGFLVGLVEAATGTPSVAAHTACVARGASRCRFVVKERPHGLE